MNTSAWTEINCLRIGSSGRSLRTRKCAFQFHKRHWISSQLLGVSTLFIIRYSKILRNTTFRQLDLFPSSGEEGHSQSVGSTTKSQPQSLDDLYPYNYCYMNTWEQFIFLYRQTQQLLSSHMDWHYMFRLIWTCSL
jgi:hypothetical protein